jgi:hypothetical protein
MPSPTEQLRTPQEVERWAHRRQPHEREAVPEPGERLLFRQLDFGEAVPAVVDQVQDMTDPAAHWGPHDGLGQADPNVWGFDEQGRIRLKADPWPWVAVRIIRPGDDGGEYLAVPQWCKEARVRGSAGWLRPGSRAHTGQYHESEG